LLYLWLLVLLSLQFLCLFWIFQVSYAKKALLHAMLKISYTFGLHIMCWEQLLDLFLIIYFGLFFLLQFVFFCFFFEDILWDLIEF
jgi:hypothetical protein